LRRRAHGNVAVLTHAEYVPTLTAAATLRVKAALSKAAWWPWPLTFWPWKWCPSRVWRDVAYLCANFGLPGPLCSQLRPDVRDRQASDRQTSDVRQKHRLMPPPIVDSDTVQYTLRYFLILIDVGVTITVSFTVSDV